MDLESLAVIAYRSKLQPPPDPTETASATAFGVSEFLSTVASSAAIPLHLRPDVVDVARQVFTDPDLEHLADREGEGRPMLLSAAGGMRMSQDSFVSGLLSSAFLQIQYRDLPFDEGTYVGLVLSGLEQLRRAAKDGRTLGYLVHGFAGVTLPEGSSLKTPWGDLHAHAASPFSRLRGRWGRDPSCILTQARDFTVVFDRSDNPTQALNSSEISTDADRLLPLVFALACENKDRPVMLFPVWSTHLLPFAATLGHMFPPITISKQLAEDVVVADCLGQVEEWSRIVHQEHTYRADMLDSRVVSAIARDDKADSLIDAVIAWEGLVGTSVEVSFRVTASLAKLLEDDPSRRTAFQRSLKGIYGLRSRVVHGDAPKPGEVNSAADEAIRVAIRALRVSYQRGKAWLELKSEARSDSILLDIPWQKPAPPPS